MRVTLFVMAALLAAVLAAMPPAGVFQHGIDMTGSKDQVIDCATAFVGLDGTFVNRRGYKITLGVEGNTTVAGTLTVVDRQYKLQGALLCSGDVAFGYAWDANEDGVVSERWIGVPGSDGWFSYGAVEDLSLSEWPAVLVGTDAAFLRVE